MMKYLIAFTLLFSFPAYAADTCKVDTYFSPNQRAEQTIVDLIGNTEKVIHVEAYQLTSKPVIEALRKARSRGVEVKALLDKTNKPKDFPFETRVAQRYKIFHNKVLIIDNAIVLTGSYNFTKNAETKNAENFVIISECQADGIAKYEREFQALWNSSK